MEFDVAIIGAGSAGCAAAARISENENLNVVLIEAGGRDRNPWLHIPVGYFRTLGNPKTDWRYVTEPCPGLNGRRIKWPRGRVLGGSSAINGLLYVRGQAEDYDGWAQLGNAGWSWQEVLPYFRRAETWAGIGENGAAETRGGDGPLHVTRSRLSRPIVDAWLEAAEAEGYAPNPDYNGARQEGLSQYQLTVRNGLRQSAATAYLKPARRRPNLEILTDAQTARIVVEEGRATGVEILRDGARQRIPVRGEVILSAGAIGSPQILMLSGIGDGEALGGALGEAGLAAPLHHLPGVGQNLQDHLQARPVYRCRASTLNTESRSLIRKLGMGLEYALRRSGPMTMAASLGAGFVKSRPECATPDIQFHIQPFSADDPVDGPHAFDAFTTSVCTLRPESRGEIRLKSADIRDAPAIHPNYLATPGDQETMVASLRIARRIVRHAPVAGLITGEHAPGPEIGDDAETLLEWARNTAITIYHPTGTCRMGPENDPKAVVDSRLRVHGIRGLRVADASIMPNIVSGNTNAPAIMIGERVADFVKEDFGA